MGSLEDIYAELRARGRANVEAMDPDDEVLVDDPQKVSLQHIARQRTADGRQATSG